MTRAELRQAVADGLNRKDLMTSPITNGWIASATTRINTMLRHRAMMKHKIIAVQSHIFALPNDFLEAQSLAINRAVNGGTITPGAARGPLEYAPPAEIRTMAADSLRMDNWCGPRWFTTHGLNMELAPWKDEREYQADLWYYGKIVLGAEDTATNFFLNDYPHVYINACMTYGHRFLLEHDTAMGYEQIFAAEIQAVNDAEENARIGRGPLIVRPPTRRLGGRHS